MTTTVPDSSRSRSPNSFAGAGSKPVFDPARVLAAPLGPLLPGLEICADVYVRNGFRLLGIPACADRDTVAREAGRLRTLIQISPAALARFCIKTGYDERCRDEDVTRCVARLQDPRSRLLCELFWPHVTDGAFTPIKTSRRLDSPEAAAAIEKAVAGKTGCEAALLKHAAAIVYHNLAIGGELAFAHTPDEWQDLRWTQALRWWNETLGDENFWHYLTERARGFDDPRVSPADVDFIKTTLPGLLLAFNALFARTYAETGHTQACENHLRIIQASEFPHDVLCQSLITTVKTVTRGRLEPLVQQAQQLLAEESDHLSRPRFAERCSPILGSALAIPSYLRRDLRLGDELVNLTEFDALAAPLHQAVNQKIDFSTDDRERSLLYNSLVIRRLLGLPLSVMLRHKLEADLQSNLGYLYPDCDVVGLDATQCWFSESDEADPDASLLLPINKITNREVRVDPIRETAGVRISFNRRRILVPRSVRAKAHHEGRSSAASSVALTDAESSALWRPPDPAATEPFVFRDGTEARSVLDVLEFAARRSSILQESLGPGHLSPWFDYRGQTALAAKIREQEYGNFSQPALVRCLVKAAAAEVSAAVAETAAQSAGEIRQEEKARAADQQQAEQKRDENLRDVDRRASADEAKINANIREAEEEFTAAAAAERTRLAESIAAVQERDGGAVARAKQEANRIAKANRSWQGAGRLEAPFIPGLALLVGASGWMLGASPWLGGLGVAVGGAIAFAFCQMVRGGRTRKARQSAAAARQALDAEIARLTQGAEQVVAGLTRQKNQRIAEEKKRLEGFAVERQRITQEATQLIDTIRRKHDQAVQRIQRQAASDTETLQKRLLSRVEIKRESAKSDFAPYQRMKSNGYRDGQEPSSSERDMTNSEQQAAMRSLGRV